MAKPRYREVQAKVIDLSASLEAVIVEGRITLRRGSSSIDLAEREAQILASVVGVGEGPPVAIVNAMAKVEAERAA